MGEEKNSLMSCAQDEKKKKKKRLLDLAEDWFMQARESFYYAAGVIAHNMSANDVNDRVASFMRDPHFR